MKAEPVECMPHEAEDAWRRFPHTVMQRVLHNELVKQIQTARDKLEKADAAGVLELLELQQEIKAQRALLAFIHRHDPQSK